MNAVRSSGAAAASRNATSITSASSRLWAAATLSASMISTGIGAIAAACRNRERSCADPNAAKIRTDIRSSLIPASPNALRHSSGPPHHTSDSRSDMAATGDATEIRGRTDNAEYSCLR
jgi:hypothetical protein